MTKKQKQERDGAIEQLRDILKPGDTVHTILEHVSRSGMSRRIRPVLLTTSADGPFVRNLGYLVGKAIGERTVDQAVVMGGCGMDMGFQLVYLLSACLYPTGFGCIGDPGPRGRRCPSNDHSNGDGDYTPYDDGTPRTTEEVGTDIPGKRANRHWHREGGYALRQEWL